MKVCIFHQQFDVDVSSGTDHAVHQWYELFSAFDVSEVAVINETTEPFEFSGDRVVAHEYATLQQFLDAVTEPVVYLEHGGADFRTFQYPDNFWLVVGGSHGLETSDISLPTSVALYPRQAATVILSYNLWQ